MNLLTKEQILTSDDIQTAIVDVKEWGGQVKVRALNAGERDDFELKYTSKTLTDARAWVASKVVINEEGQQIFSTNDIKALSQKSSAPLSRIFTKATELSGVTKEDIDELEKQ